MLSRRRERVRGTIAALMLAAAGVVLASCVYPAGPGYYGSADYYYGWPYERLDPDVYVTRGRAFDVDRDRDRGHDHDNDHDHDHDFGHHWH